MRKFDPDFVADSEHRLLAETGRVSPQHLVWYVPKPEGAVAEPVLDKLFRGPVEVALLRSAWNDSSALFVGVKAGYNQANHSHLDLGNFELDALGVRWARDLGSDNYNLPGYWGSQRGGTRWQYYRLNTFSHNVPALGGKDQDPLGKATLTWFEADGAAPCAQIDLTDAYRESAQSVQRGVALVGDRKAVLVQDAFEIADPCEVAWGMTTDAEIEVNGGEALLTLEGKQLRAKVLAPEGAVFVSESAEQEAPQKANEGIRRLNLRLPAQSGAIQIAVLLAPVWAEGECVSDVAIKPLAEW